MFGGKKQYVGFDKETSPEDHIIDVSHKSMGYF